MLTRNEVVRGLNHGPAVDHPLRLVERLVVLLARDREVGHPLVANGDPCAAHHAPPRAPSY